MPFNTLLQKTGLVATLRSVKPDEIVVVGERLYAAELRLTEIPMNSPEALQGISILCDALPKDCLVGAGTMLSVEQVVAIKGAGDQIIVVPHCDIAVIRRTRALGMYCVPGVATPAEAFATIEHGANTIKLFPAGQITSGVTRAWRTVIPQSIPMLPVGGITPEIMVRYLSYGASGFDLGSALYRPGMTPEQVYENAVLFMNAWDNSNSDQLINKNIKAMIKHLTLPKKMAVVVLLVDVALSIAPVQVASYPTKQIGLVVPYTAGGDTDLVAHAFAGAAKNHLPVSIGVINKPGEGDAIDLSEIATTHPNGYEVGLGTVELITFPNLGMVRFETSGSKPIARLNTDPTAIAIRADTPWNSYEELMAYSRADPERVRIGNSDTGTIWHLAAAALEDKTGTKFSRVPYDSAIPAITGLLGGHIGAASVGPREVINRMNGGKLKTLVVMAGERMKTMPDVPTLKEESVDLSIGTQRGLIVSQGTPQDVVDVLTRAAKETAEEPAFQDALQKLNLNYMRLDTASFQAQISEQGKCFDRLLTRLGLKR